MTPQEQQELLALNSKPIPVMSRDDLQRNCFLLRKQLREVQLALHFPEPVEPYKTAWKAKS